MSTGLTLISLNVRGIREKVKRKRILEWCKNYFAIGTRVKTRNPKKSVKYIEDSMKFTLIFQTMDFVGYHSSKFQGGFFSSN